MKKGMTFALAAGTAALVGGIASADILFFDANSSDWQAFLAAGNKQLKDDVDFGRLNDFGIVGWPGPLTNAGTPDGLIPAGFVGDNVSINASDAARAQGLVGVGPSVGFGNPRNLLAANYFVDSLQMTFSDELKTAVSIEVWSLLGSHAMDVTVNGHASINVANGRNLGIGATNGEVISLIDIFDGGGGAEGIMGYKAYNAVPAPGALALLGLAGVAARRRRR
jgi:hypothetical protein